MTRARLELVADESFLMESSLPEEKRAVAMPAKSDYDVVVVGGGPAGLTAATFSGQRSLRAALFEGDCLGGILTRWCPEKRIDNYPGVRSGVRAEELAGSLIDEARRAKVDLIEKRVDRITDGGEVHAGDVSVRGKVVILASGSTAAEASIPRERELFEKDGGVFYEVPSPRFFRGKKVVVIGGGETAITHVERLSGVASRITLVHRMETLRAAGIRLPEEFEPERGVSVLLRSAVEALLGEKHVEGVRVRHVDTGEESEIPADAVVIAAGRKPNTAIIHDLHLSVDGKGRVTTDRWQRTSRPRIYAVGDVTSHLKMIVTAVAQGATAAHQAYAEVRSPYWK